MCWSSFLEGVRASSSIRVLREKSFSVAHVVAGPLRSELKFAPYSSVFGTDMHASFGLPGCSSEVLEGTGRIGCSGDVRNVSVEPTGVTNDMVPAAVCSADSVKLVLVKSAKELTLPEVLACTELLKPVPSLRASWIFNEASRRGASSVTVSRKD